MGFRREREKKNINVGISFPRIFGEEPILEEVIIKLKFVGGGNWIPVSNLRDYVKLIK